LTVQNKIGEIYLLEIDLELKNMKIISKFETKIVGFMKLPVNNDQIVINKNKKFQ